jgi:hypothetical protein
MHSHNVAVSHPSYRAACNDPRSSQVPIWGTCDDRNAWVTSKNQPKSTFSTNENQFLIDEKMEEMKIAFSVETIREMISHALCNPQLKIEVKRGFGAMFG